MQSASLNKMTIRCWDEREEVCSEALSVVRIIKRGRVPWRAAFNSTRSANQGLRGTEPDPLPYHISEDNIDNSLIHIKINCEMRNSWWSSDQWQILMHREMFIRHSNIIMWVFAVCAQSPDLNFSWTQGSIFILHLQEIYEANYWVISNDMQRGERESSQWHKLSTGA